MAESKILFEGMIDVAAKGEEVSAQFEVLKKYGSLTKQQHLMLVDSLSDGQVTGEEVTFLEYPLTGDLAEHTFSGEELLFSADKFTKAFYFNQTMMAISGINDGVLVDVNSSFAACLGYKREELIGKCMIENWVDPRDRERAISRLLDTGYVRDYELQFRKKSGEIGSALASLNLLNVGTQKLFIFSAVDITERKQTEEALRLSQELFYTTFNANPLPMVILSKHGETFLEINQAFSERTGWTREELIGQKVSDLEPWLDLKVFQRFEEAIEKDGFVKNLEAGFRRKKTGEKGTALLSAVNITWNSEECLLVIANDISELRLYEKEMARLDRLNLAGEMAAGISHEIRNPMTTVRGFLQLLREKGRYAEDRAFMDLMIEELDRANAIITEFLSLAKNKSVDLKIRSLNRSLKALYPLLQADAGKQDKDIVLELNDIPDVLFDKNEIHQLILNLALNGLEAMEPGGRLTLKTFRENDRVVLAVRDQGSGIPSEILEKLGTPFITTKENGTGLGMAVCYSIAQRNNAVIEIDTGSEGTTVYVKFEI